MANQEKGAKIVPRGDACRTYCVESAIRKDRGNPYPFCSAIIKRFKELREERLPDLVLDLGCSVGHNTICLSQMGFQTYGLDVLPEIVTEANKRNNRAGSKAFFVSGVGESMPFKDNSFDFVFANEVMEHVRDPKMVIHEIYRVLKPGGLAYISTTNKLCYRTGEVRHFSFFFAYLPQKLKDRFIDRHPALVNYALFPARHWFTPRGLSKTLTNAGFNKVWDLIDRVDTIKPEEIPPGIWQISRPFLPLIKVLPRYLKLPLYISTPGGGTFWARK